MSNLLEQTFMQVNIGIIAVDRECNVILCNHFMSDYTKKTVSDIVGHNLFEVYHNLPKIWLKRRIKNIFLLKNSSFISWEQRQSLFDFDNSRPITGTNKKMVQNCSLFPILDDENKVSHVCITVADATATAINQIQLKKTSNRLLEEKKSQQKLIKKLEEAKSQLLQSEKMASIGQLAAGVAHEINNPVGFIKSNFSSLKHYAKELNDTIQCYGRVLEGINSDDVNQAVETINAEHDIDFVIEDLTNLLNESFDGVNRIEEIVKSLKHFSRSDTQQWEEADINAGIQSTLKVVAHELKYLAALESNFETLPLVECLPMQINQVVMNLLVNASQAISQNQKDGKVTISTNVCDDKVVIMVQDNGQGIEEALLTKIFDPFFTTKEVGKGTGLGLSLSYSIIQKHKGDLTVESEEGVGTTFRMVLPVSQRGGEAA